MDLERLELSWLGENGEEWIDSLTSEVDIDQLPGVEKLNLNVTLVRKKVVFDKLLDKFIALLGIHLATKPDTWERSVLIVFLALIVCPLQLKFFRSNATKKAFDLIASEDGDHYIHKKHLKKDKALRDVVDRLIRLKMVEPDGDRYYFNVVILKSVNIGK